MPNQRRRQPDEIRSSDALPHIVPLPVVTDDAIQVAPISCTRRVAANPVRSLMIGFVRNANFVNRQRASTTMPRDLAARPTRRIAQITSTPEIPAPQVFCPGCGLPLVYRQTVIGGVKPIERWDYFDCRACGQYVYRDRTRTLRRP